MLDGEYGMNAQIQLSEDVDENGDELCFVIVKVEEDLEKEMNFEENSYLYRGENENVIISHVANYEQDKTLIKEEGKITYVIILNTHMYVKKEDENGIRGCFRAYANAIKNKDNWLRMPEHDKTNL